MFTKLPRTTMKDTSEQDKELVKVVSDSIANAREHLGDATRVSEDFEWLTGISVKSDAGKLAMAFIISNASSANSIVDHAERVLKKNKVRVTKGAENELNRLKEAACNLIVDGYIGITGIEYLNGVFEVVPRYVNDAEGYVVRAGVRAEKQVRYWRDVVSRMDISDDLNALDDDKYSS